LSGTTQASRYQKGKTSLDFTEARDSEWQWHQLGRMQVCTSVQTDNHTSTFLPPNQQRQSTEGIWGGAIMGRRREGVEAEKEMDRHLPNEVASQLFLVVVAPMVLFVPC